MTRRTRTAAVVMGEAARRPGLAIPPWDWPPGWPMMGARPWPWPEVCSCGRSVYGVIIESDPHLDEHLVLLRHDVGKIGHLAPEAPERWDDLDEDCRHEIPWHTCDTCWDEWSSDCIDPIGTFKEMQRDATDRRLGREVVYSETPRFAIASAIQQKRICMVVSSRRSMWPRRAIVALFDELESRVRAEQVLRAAEKLVGAG